ncbi:competence protein ComFA [Planomicrobium soli]|uniref:Competence protein ComFA n=1 Tax=Planomicrobium soli TaxID=1176648 RepID=A0A2P8GCC5_9BACL|nr:DEAD/DEAH box helicase [Planomicrobium soli]PSL31620.1 competence protein ComFA [Planomicrobium soli]
MTELEQFLTGRIWIREFMPFAQEEVDAAIAAGNIGVKKGITENKECARCLEKSPQKIISFHCAKCQTICSYCRICLKMGRISSCTELIFWTGPSPKPQSPHSYTWNGTLTKLQQKACNEVLESLSKNSSHLVYAVCGAGKTELLFPPLAKALEKGQRICIAAPRTDVVLELAPRIKAVFPDTVIHTLYGGSPKETGFPHIIIATTHQLFRFEDAFNLIIVDEADAFPYSYDPSLERAVMKSKKKEAPIVYVSATPSDRLLKDIPNQSRIFRRFHGHPLPVPQFQPLWNYKKKFSGSEIPKPLALWIQKRLANREPFLVFLPTVEMIEKVTPLFKNLDRRIEAVHASDPERKEKVMKLRKGDIMGVLTSTILERGITIPNVQVAVVGADETIFDAAALIQIAGRVGRSIDFPAGDIVFFHNGIVRQMDKAKKQILSYNRMVSN